MVEDAAAASGDFEEEVEKAPAPPPPAPPIPDVELIEDGFGFMPDSRVNKKKKRRSSGSKQIAMGEEASSCSTSTSLNIVRRYTWKTKNRMIVQVITYGATVTSIQVPDRKGEPDDVLAGFETLEAKSVRTSMEPLPLRQKECCWKNKDLAKQKYLSPRNPFFGSTIGRCANFIREGAMRIKPSGRNYLLSLNKGYHHFNGGFLGFDKINWRSYICGNKVIMSHVSDHLHEGYPGSLMTQITFEVTCDNTLKIDMQCTTTAPTMVNLSNSLFFNLAGHHAGPNDMFEHIVTINADKYTPADDYGLVIGKKEVVGGTAYDFRVPRMLRKMIPLIPLGGYDVNFCVTQATAQDLTFHARAIHPVSGRVMEIYSNQPGVQFYTGNLLPDPDRIYEEPSAEEEGVHEGSSSESEGSKGEEETDDESKGKQGYGYVPLCGKQGTTYKKHGLFCFMPQNYPDAINNPNFPNAILNPGEVYNHKIQLRFGILLGRYT